MRVLLAVPDTAVEAALLRRMGRADAGTTVVRRCLDLSDLLAAAGRQGADAVVVSRAVRHLDRDAVATLHGHGLRVVVLCAADAEGSDDARVARGLGADAVVGPDPDDLLTALRAPARPPLSEPSGAGPAGAPAEDRGRHGDLVAVWGPIGSPGRTTVALTVADEAARLGVGSVLADADTYGATLALRLGLLDDVSGLAAACRAAASGRLDDAALVRSTQLLPSGLRVLTGLPRVDRWSELRPAALDEVWSVCRSVAQLTVVDVGFGIEHDPETDFDPTVPERDGAARSTLAAADAVLCVGRCDPVGVVRLLRSLPDVRSVAPTARLVGVLVASPRDRWRPDDGEAARRLLAERAGLTEAVLVQDNRSAVAASAWAGATLAEHAPTAPARLAMAELAAQLVGMPVPARRALPWRSVGSGSRGVRRRAHRAQSSGEQAS
jgi:MinD-like ATPase involved in chromosome partitioning or flagellar assembly